MISVLLGLGVAAEAAILYVCFRVLPRVSAAGVLFTVAVPGSFPDSADGVRIQAEYRRIIGKGTLLGIFVGWLALAALHVASVPAGARPFALLATGIVQYLAMYIGMLKARRAVRAALSSMAAPESPRPLDTRRAASLVARPPVFPMSLWIGPFALLVLAAVLFRAGGIPLRTNATLLLATACPEALLFILWLEVPKFRRLHLSGGHAEQEAARHDIMQWAMLLGSYALSWGVLMRWAEQMGSLNGPARLVLALAPFTLVMAFLWARFMWTFRASLSEKGETSSPGGDKTPERAWFLGLLYCNKNDPAIFVRERWGAGWTMNLGNPIVQATLLVGALALLMTLALK